MLLRFPMISLKVIVISTHLVQIIIVVIIITIVSYKPEAKSFLSSCQTILFEINFVLITYKQSEIKSA